MRLIDADMLCNYCDNNINHSITPNEIMRMPFIDYKPVKHGRWVEMSHHIGEFDEDGNVYGLSITSARCSECGLFSENLQQYSPHMPDYCGHCGAKMDGSENK